jgi:hypothetical protein
MTRAQGIREELLRTHSDTCVRASHDHACGDWGKDRLRVHAHRAQACIVQVDHAFEYVPVVQADRVRCIPERRSRL